MNKRTIVFDFDGVIHSYTSGWKGETEIPDPLVSGIKEALTDLSATYEIAIVSTRCKTHEGRSAIEKYLEANGLLGVVSRVLAEKPPAIVYVDDRAICFDGHPEHLRDQIESFRPWNKKAVQDE